VFQDTAEWSSAEKILFVRLDTIGDVLMTTPAMRAFKERSPDVSLTLLTSPTGSTVARLIPEIDEVLVYEAPWMKASAPRSTSSADWKQVDELRERAFDAAVIPTVYSQNPLPSAFLCFLAEIPLRAAHCRENPYQLLTHWLKDPEPETLVRHEVQRHLDLVAALGMAPRDTRLSLCVSEAARVEASMLLSTAGLELERPWVLVHPGSTAPSRRYPVGHYADALRLLHDETGVQFAISGDAEDKELTRELAVRLGAVPAALLAGRTSLEVLAAVIEKAPLLISNNTGPVHIAAAVGTPVVDLYALTNPQHTPWQVPNRVLFADVPCRICYKSVCPQGHNKCLVDVSPRAVADAATELLGLCASSSNDGA